MLAEKERADHVLQSIADAVITTDIHEVVEYLSPVAERLSRGVWARRVASRYPRYAASSTNARCNRCRRAWRRRFTTIVTVRSAATRVHSCGATARRW
jgi:hypothetical protein